MTELFEADFLASEFAEIWNAVHMVEALNEERHIHKCRGFHFSNLMKLSMMNYSRVNLLICV